MKKSFVAITPILFFFLVHPIFGAVCETRSARGQSNVIG